MAQPQVVPAAGAAQLVSDLLSAGNHGNMKVMLTLCGDVLVNEDVNKELILHTITSLKSHVPDICEETLTVWQGLFYKTIVAVKRLVQVDEVAAIEAMKIFNAMILQRLPVIDPHFLEFVKFCIQIITKNHHGDGLVGKVLALLASVMNLRWRDQIRDLKLIEPVLKTSLSVMCKYDRTERNTLDNLASKVVCSLAPFLTEDEVMPVFLKHVTRALESPSPLLRRAAFMAMAACCKGSEGRTCEDYLAANYLDSFLFPRVYTGLCDPSAEVCQSALVALGQFSKILQPKVGVYLATTLHPLLFTCLRKMTDDQTMPYKDMRSGYSALVMICESLHKEILPYLDELIRFLVNVIESSADRIKPLALEALKNISEAAGPDLAPYLPKIRLCLNRFLNTDVQEEQRIRSSAYLCLATVGKSVGDQFHHYKNDLQSAGIALLEMVQKSKLQGIDDTTHAADINQACLALGMISRSAGVQFLPHFKQTHDEILPLVKHPEAAIRSSSLAFIGELCCAQWSVEQKRHVKELDVELSDILQTTIQSDVSRKVVIAVLKALDMMLKVIGRPVIKNAVVTDVSDGVNDGGQAAVLAVMTDVIEEQTCCQRFYQRPPEEYTDEMEKERFELLEVFGNTIPSLASTTDGAAFFVFFTTFLNEELPDFSDSEEDWAYCCDLFIRMNLLSQTVANMNDDSAASFVDRFYEMLLEALGYEAVRTRRNAVYGLGVLTACGGQATASRYFDTLEIFNTILHTETDSGVKDKVYAAICRMISSNHSAVPMMDYLPALISRLPLQHDYSYGDNNLPVYQCLLGLYRSSTLPDIEGLLAKLISVAGQLLDESRINREMRSLLVEFLSEMECKEQAVLSRVLEETSLGAQRSIKACLSEGS